MWTGFTLLSQSPRGSRSGAHTHMIESILRGTTPLFCLIHFIYDSIQLQPHPTRRKIVAQDPGSVELISLPPLARKASYRHELMRAHKHNCCESNLTPKKKTNNKQTNSTNLTTKSTSFINNNSPPKLVLRLNTYQF
jgi:hypothetical protein